jgi:putative ABC transport system permease protein
MMNDPAGRRTEPLMWKVTIKGLLARKLRLALTALAIVLGVTFVSGTLILTDTLDHTFDNLIGNAYQHISFQIRGKAPFGNNNTAAAANGTSRKPIPESIATAVAGARRRLRGRVGRRLRPVRGPRRRRDRGRSLGPGVLVRPERQLSAVRLVAGRGPTTADDVVMDRATATKYHFKIGDRCAWFPGQPPKTFTISGLVTFGADNNLAAPRWPASPCRPPRRYSRRAATTTRSTS